VWCSIIGPPDTLYRKQPGSKQMISTSSVKFGERKYLRVARCVS